MSLAIDSSTSVQMGLLPLISLDPVAPESSSDLYLTIRVNVAFEKPY